jgi:hypothetical protein
LVASGPTGNAEPETGERNACDDRGNPLAEQLTPPKGSVFVDDG